MSDVRPAAPKAADQATDRLASALLVLRIVLGLFLMQWAVEKFVNPQGAVGIFGHFYGIDLAGLMPQIIGGFELVLVIAFMFGAWRRVTYGLVMLIHAVSVVSTWRQLIDPYGGQGNHLFTAGVPVLAAFLVLYRLRESDVLWSWDARRISAGGS